ncbi:MAG: heavy-metal-associated domain-containing protein [Gemmatimonadetes bacterium]|nr:heavy-metal-associated domain-containing protein [Gemmatimonadota bacterium]
MLMGLLGAGAIGGFAICDLCKPAANAGAALAAVAQAETALLQQPMAESQKVKLRVEGMTCGGCAISARMVLERLDGVEKAEVDFERKLAVVTYDPEQVTPEHMIQTLRQKLGYEAAVVEEAVS